MTTKNDTQTMIERAGFFTGGGMVARLGLRVLFLAMAGQLYGAENFGIFALGVAVSELLVAAGGLENKTMLFRYLDERADGVTPESVLADAHLLNLAACTIVVAFSAGVIAGWTLLFGSDPVLTMIAILLPVVFLQVSLDLILSAIRWQHTIRYEIWCRHLVESAVLVAASFAAYHAGAVQYGLVIGYFAGVLSALAVAIFGLFRHYEAARLSGFRPSVERWRAMLRTSSTNTLAGIVHVAGGRIDLWLVGLLLGQSAAGLFAMARQMQSPTTGIRRSLDGIVTPLASKVLTKDGSGRASAALASVSRRILAFNMAILILLLACGHELLAIAGAEFLPAYWCMILLAFAETIQAAYGISDLVFRYRSPRLILMMTLGTIATGIIAGLLLIPPFGITGAAVAVLVTYVARAILRDQLLRRRFGLELPFGFCIEVYIAGAVGILVALAFGSPGMDQELANVLDWPISLAAVALGVAAFWIVLKAILRWRGTTLEITHFDVD